MTDLNRCPKCGGPLNIQDVDEEITYLRITLVCEGTVQDTGYPGTQREADCGFVEIREIDIDDIREYGMLQEE